MVAVLILPLLSITAKTIVWVAMGGILNVVGFVMGPMGSVTLRLLLMSLSAPPLPVQETLCIARTLSATLDSFAPLQPLQVTALGFLGMFQGAYPCLTQPQPQPQPQQHLPPL